jgi:hypothetical protein
MEVQTQVNKRSLAEHKVHEIRQRLEAELQPAIGAVESELAQIAGATADWRDTAGNPANVERLEEDRKRLLNRRAILTDARDRAQSELRQAEAQVEVDELAEHAVDYQKIGDARIQRARDMVATAQTLAAMVVEDDLQRTQMVNIANRVRRYFVGRSSGAEEMRRSNAHAELLALLKPIGERGTETNIQQAIEHVLAHNIPAHLWVSEMRQTGKVADAVTYVLGQCRGGLTSMRECMQRLVADAKGS